MSEAATINKLIILYTLDQIDFPMTNGQLTEFIMEQQYMDYLTMQETLSDLISSDLIDAKKMVSRTEYRITDQGTQTLGFFKDRVSASIRKDVKDFLKKNSMVLKNDASVVADYYRTTDREYAVNCKITENGYTLLDLTITVPTEVQAQSTMLKWKEKHQEIYSHIMTELL